MTDGKRTTEKEYLELLRETVKEQKLSVVQDLKPKLKKHTPEEWLDVFNTFSIYQILPQLIELWGLNVQTDVSAKKNFVQQIAR